jgi:hypothetical protein
MADTCKPNRYRSISPNRGTRLADHPAWTDDACSVLCLLQFRPMRFRFRKTILASTLTAVVGVATWLALPADAATTPVLQFTYIVYDSPGKDTRTNASLNAEYVRITNTTGQGDQHWPGHAEGRRRAHLHVPELLAGRPRPGLAAKAPTLKPTFTGAQVTTSGITPATPPRCATSPDGCWTRASGPRSAPATQAARSGGADGPGPDGEPDTGGSSCRVVGGWHIGGRGDEDTPDRYHVGARTVGQGARSRRQRAISVQGSPKCRIVKPSTSLLVGTLGNPLASRAAMRSRRTIRRRTLGDSHFLHAARYACLSSASQ